MIINTLALSFSKNLYIANCCYMNHIFETSITIVLNLSSIRDISDIAINFISPFFSVGKLIKREGQKKLKKRTRWQGNKGENTGTMDFQPLHDLRSEPPSLSSLVRGILPDQGPHGARPAPPPPPVTGGEE